MNHEGFKTKTVVTEAGCWEWSSTIASGYPVVQVKRSFVSARKIAWTLFKGEVPRGSKIFSKCGNKCCVNPDHLDLREAKQRRSLTYKPIRIMVAQERAAGETRLYKPGFARIRGRPVFVGVDATETWAKKYSPIDASVRGPANAITETGK